MPVRLMSSVTRIVSATDKACRRELDQRNEKGRLQDMQPTLFFEPHGSVLSDRPMICYWMTETLPPAVNGSVGAFAPPAPTSCQTAPAWLVANARLPVDVGLVGTAVA